MTCIFDGKQTFWNEELSDLWGKGELLHQSLPELFTVRSS